MSYSGYVGLAVPLAGTIAESMMSLLPLSGRLLNFTLFQYSSTERKALEIVQGNLFYPISKELKLSEAAFPSCEQLYIYISFFLVFTETYDLATLVDNPTQLPRHYRRMLLYLYQKC